MSQLVKTIKDHCHECYSCVRNCPAKAVRVRNGQAEVIEERCINCANCVQICSQGAKKVKNEKDIVKNLLNKNEKLIAGLAPSFPAFKPEWHLADWRKLLKGIGFNNIYEVAFGAELVIEEYKKLLNNKTDMVISTPCPVVVKFVEKYYPELVPNLAPIVSPMVALARYINYIIDDEFDIVMIGPCQAKKIELEEEPAVSAVLTFSELIELIEELDLSNKVNTKNKTKLNDLSSDIDDSKQKINYGRQIPLSGGLKEALLADEDKSQEIVQVEGSEKISSLFTSIIKGRTQTDFVDVLFCDGCISGVDLLEKDFFQKKKAIKDFINLQPDNEENNYYNKNVSQKLNLRTNFTEDFKGLPSPKETEIWNILNKTNKYQEEDLLNCGACGYESCRKKAVAVYQDLAEVEMCLPYLLSEKRSEIEEVQKLNKELDELINSSYDGLLMVNKDGVIERTNEAYQDMINRNQEYLIGKNLTDLEEKEIIYPSVALLSLNEQRRITLLQNTDDGKQILATANPITTQNGKLRKVIVNARDINDLDNLISKEEKNKIENYLDEEESTSAVNIGPPHIICNSKKMKEIIKLAERISDTDSTVLITGESGVGKEVVARYIHKQSQNREDFVKINCAAIPETLLESELFGYETGAFSGAKQEGKSGLIEKADKGTLFLDEIGEIPLNMQAKLLQVIQEHKLTRIGGIEEIPVDFRLITATNRNLEKMVQNKEFREDLYYRLNVVPIKIPPLRKRKEDISPLLNYFIQKLNKKYGKEIRFASDARAILENYKWPGNIRELINFLERIIVTSKENIIDEGFIKRFLDRKETETPKIEINQIMSLPDAVKEVEKQLLRLARQKGKSTYDMAELLGVNQSTIVRKLNKYFD